MLSASALSQTEIFFRSSSPTFQFTRSRASNVRSSDLSNQQRGKRHEYKLVFGVVVGAALGAAAIQGLHAQAKPKAYTISELETLDPAAQAAFTPLAQAAQKAAGGRTFVTGGGRIVGLDGAPPPKRVVINEFDSLEQAEAYYKSKAWNDLAPQRDKAIKTIRRYAVEANK